MILNNYKRFILYMFSHGYVDPSVSNEVYVKDYLGENVSIYGGHDDHWSDRDASLQCPHALFTGGQTDSQTRLSAIMDFSTEEDMVLSSTLFNYGKRSSSYSYCDPGSPQDISNVNTGSSGMLILGSGDTPPTKEDYKLESWIPTTDLRIESYSIMIPISETLDGPPEYIGAFIGTFRNVSLSNISVKEAGIITPYAARKESYTKTKVSKVLLIRDVLENPVIIKPGELYTFSLTIK